MRSVRRPIAWLAGLSFAAALVWILAIAVAYETVPDGNTTQNRFDTIIVLGTPTQPDGSPSPEMRERVEEGVREYKAGVAPHLIMTGASAHNRFVEAHAMALLAEQKGIPADTVIEETHAQDTIQNIWYSHQIMEANGWHSAMVVSSPYHLPRTALILRRYTGPEEMKWRTHPSHWPRDYSLVRKTQRVFREAVGCFRIRTHGFPSSRYLPH